METYSGIVGLILNYLIISWIHPRYTLPIYFLIKSYLENKSFDNIYLQYFIDNPLTLKPFRPKKNIITIILGLLLKQNNNPNL